ncbi:MAG: serine/threonine-protein kinase, partial [Pseudomonadota bacterium]
GLLGRGGMGEVYAAYDPDLDRKIALKLLRARGGSSDADGGTRLLREAQAIARLSHPNVVVVFDVGTFRESVFIAMEFVEGHTLAYWIEAQKRTWREVLDVYCAAGRGLVAAHAAGLVHRDFKPDNVMITKSGQVRVMDFGLARQQGRADETRQKEQLTEDNAARAALLAAAFGGGADAEATAVIAAGPAAPASTTGGYLELKLTHTGTMLGTPAYMAPEQFAGTGGDARTDQFSFCVALYEGMYRQRPFAGNNPLDLMANVVAGRVKEPPTDARVPAWIRRILLRGLSPRPDARFASMVDLLAALGQDPAVRRRRWVGAAAGLAVLIAAAGSARRFSAGHQSLCSGGPDRAAGAWGSQRRADVERAFTATGSPNAARAFAGVATLIDDYVARWVGMYKETCESTHVRGEQSAEVLDLRMGCLAERLSGVRALGDVLVSADSAVVDNAVSAASSLPALDRCADTAMLRAVVKPPADTAARAQVAAVREKIAKVKALGDSGQCETAASLATHATDEAKRIGYLPVRAAAEFAAGRLMETCTDAVKGIALLQDATEDAEASHHDEVFIESTLVLGAMFADRMNDTRRGEDNIRHSRAVLSRFPGHPALQAWLDGASAIVAMNEGRYEQAVAFENRAYEARRRLYGETNYEVTSSLNNMAIDLHGLHRDREAEELSAKAVEIGTRLFGSDSTRNALLLVNHSEMLTALGRFAEAHAAVEKALSTWRRQTAGDYLIGYGLLDLGRIQVEEGAAGEAVKTLEEALRVLGDKYAAPTAEAKFILARALWTAAPRSRGRALALARAAREILAQHGGSVGLADEIEAWQATHHAT